MELYTCSTDRHESDIPAEWDADGGGKGNITFPKSYNELATLMSVPGVRAFAHAGCLFGGVICWQSVWSPF